MKLFGKIRYCNGSCSAFLLFGIPLYTKKQDSIIKKIRLFGILPILSRENDGGRIVERILGIRVKCKSNKSNWNGGQPAYTFAEARELADAYRVCLNNMKKGYFGDHSIKRKKITVLFDGTGMAWAKNRGIGIYIHGLLDELAKIDDLSIDMIFHEDCHLKSGISLPENVGIKSWHDFNDLPFVYDFMFFGVPVGFYTDKIFKSPVKMSKFQMAVGVCYDIIPIMYPAENHDTINNTVNNYWIFFKRLDHIFAISEFTKQNMTEVLGIDPKICTNIYGAPGREWIKTGSGGIKNNNLVACLGGDLRKNVVKTCQAFCIAMNSNKIPADARLVITSYMEGNSDVVKDAKAVIANYPGMKVGENIIIPDHLLSMDYIMETTRRARAAIYGSVFEGLGLPVLEAYAVGTPCIGSNNTSIREIIEPSCQFDPFDADDMAERMIQIYNDQKLRQKSLDFGRELLAKDCNWAVAAKKVADAFRKLKK